MSAERSGETTQEKAESTAEAGPRRAGTVARRPHMTTPKTTEAEPRRAGTVATGQQANSQNTAEAGPRRAGRRHHTP